MLAVELAIWESQSSWKEFLEGLQVRELKGVELVLSADHAGLRRVIRELLSETVWQRWYVLFLRNTLDCLPRKAVDDRLVELRWIYERRDLGAWLAKWGPRCPKLCARVEENIEETLSFYRLPRQHHMYLLERLMEEIKRRTLVVRIFPDAASCLRSVRVLAAEFHEDWIEGMRYLDMKPLKEQKKEAVRQPEEAA